MLTGIVKILHFSKVRLRSLLFLIVIQLAILRMSLLFYLRLATAPRNLMNFLGYLVLLVMFMPGQKHLINLLIKQMKFLAYLILFLVKFRILILNIELLLVEELFNYLRKIKMTAHLVQHPILPLTFPMKQSIL